MLTVGKRSKIVQSRSVSTKNVPCYLEIMAPLWLTMMGKKLTPPLKQKSKNIFIYVCYANETNYVKKYDVWRIWRTFSHVRTTFSHENIESRKKSWKVRWDNLEGFQISRNQIQKGAKYKLFLLIWSVNCKYFCDSASDDNEIWCVR